MMSLKATLVALLAWLGLAAHYDVDAEQLASDTAGAVAYATLLPPPVPLPSPPAGIVQPAPIPKAKVKPVPLTQPMRVPYYSPRWRRW